MVMIYISSNVPSVEVGVVQNKQPPAQFTSPAYKHLVSGTTFGVIVESKSANSRCVCVCVLV